MKSPEWVACEMGRVWAVRLYPGSDLRVEIERWAHSRQVRAAVIGSAVGSLSIVSLRFAGVSSAWNEGRDWEILSLNGTVSISGLHLHLAVADSEGRTYGGHLLNGSTIRTTAEIVINELQGTRFLREPDTATGFRELVIRKDTPGT